MYIWGFFYTSKAFDKTNHLELFTKLLDRKIPTIIVRILLVWYKKQQFYVRWNGNLSDGFKVNNGVRHGGILSPYLINVYLDDLSSILNNVCTGCLLNGVRINHLFYPALYTN